MIVLGSRMLFTPLGSREIEKGQARTYSNSICGVQLFPDFPISLEVTETDVENCIDPPKKNILRVWTQSYLVLTF